MTGLRLCCYLTNLLDFLPLTCRPSLSPRLVVVLGLDIEIPFPVSVGVLFVS